MHIGHEESPQTATFVTYAEGPLEMNRCVGKVAWRISAWEGDCQSPFLQYRDWYWKTYELDAAAALRERRSRVSPVRRRWGAAARRAPG